MPDRIGLILVFIVVTVIAGDFLNISPARILRKIFRGTPLTDDGDGFSGKAKMLLLDIMACSVLVGGLMLIYSG